MSTTQQDKPGGKSRKRNRKSGQPGPRPEQQQPGPMPDRPEEELIEPILASTPANVAAMPVDEDPVSVQTDYPVSLQTIADAYGDYGRKSLRETRSFFERLMAVRSLDKAIEVQAEFTRQSCADFVAESQKIGELYREYARQVFRPWGFAAKMTQAGTASWPTSQSRH